MNNTIIRGKIQPSLKFYNRKSGKSQYDIWDELEQGLWQNYSIENALFNNSLGDTKQVDWKPIFPEIVPINPGFKWDYKNETLTEDLYTPHIKAANIKTFLDAAEIFFHKFDDKKIGVHLSGGLDSGLIICLLKYFNIPFVAAGLTSNRFEFRTEKHIQKILADYSDDSVLLDLDEYPFYSNLEKKAKHQIPDAYIKSVNASTALAKTFSLKGCDVVFSGQGGDTLLVNAVNKKKLCGYNIGNEFLIPFDEDFIYSPQRIQLISMYSDTTIIDQITSLRSGEKEDPLKLWARNFFRKFLPKELSEFTYSADFFGLSMDGLNMAKPVIKILFEEAYDYIKHPIFSAKGIKKMLKTDVFSLEYKTYCELCTKISIATWLHSLFRKDD